MELEPPIYHYGDDTIKLAELDVEVSLDHLDIKEITFYNIDAVGSYTEDDVDYGVVFVVGKEFLCPLTYEQLKDVVREARKY